METPTQTQVVAQVDDWSWVRTAKGGQINIDGLRGETPHHMRITIEDGIVRFFVQSKVTKGWLMRAKITDFLSLGEIKQIIVKNFSSTVVHIDDEFVSDLMYTINSALCPGITSMTELRADASQNQFQRAWVTTVSNSDIMIRVFPTSPEHVRVVLTKQDGSYIFFDRTFHEDHLHIIQDDLLDETGILFNFTNRIGGATSLEHEAHSVLVQYNKALRDSMSTQEYKALRDRLKKDETNLSSPPTETPKKEPTMKTRKDSMKDAIAEGARLGVAGGVNNALIEGMKKAAGEKWPEFLDTEAGRATLRLVLPLLIVNLAPNATLAGITEEQARKLQAGGELMLSAATAQDLQAFMGFVIQNVMPMLSQVTSLGEQVEGAAQIEEKAEVEDMQAKLDKIAAREKVPTKVL